MTPVKATDNPIFKQISDEIAETNIVLYMKGNIETPMCGFSGYVVKLLQTYGVAFKAINVLDDPELRQGIKDYSSWPTIPQLYVKGEFIGGCDILKEMHEAGELEAVIGNR